MTPKKTLHCSVFGYCSCSHQSLIPLNLLLCPGTLFPLVGAFTLVPFVFHFLSTALYLPALVKKITIKNLQRCVCVMVVHACGEASLNQRSFFVFAGGF